MSRKRAMACAGAAGVFLLLFGFLCLNYTKGFDLERHRAWAVERGLPEPSLAVYWLGLLLLALGAGLLGWFFGRRRRSE